VPLTGTQPLRVNKYSSLTPQPSVRDGIVLTAIESGSCSHRSQTAECGNVPECFGGRVAFHLGETLPFLVWRIDQALARPGAKTLSFRDAFCGHFYITTSGNFSNPALLCCVMELGIDRILFAVRLAVRRQQAGGAVDGNRSVVRRGQGQDPERQRPAAASALAAFARLPPTVRHCMGDGGVASALLRSTGP
jgi:hypothetical protein